MGRGYARDKGLRDSAAGIVEMSFLLYLCGCRSHKGWFDRNGCLWDMFEPSPPRPNIRGASGRDDAGRVPFLLKSHVRPRATKA